MGYTKDGSIRKYWPDNTETEYYRYSTGGDSISDIIEYACNHFGCTKEFLMDNCTIEADYIHTDCLGYDRYDSSDYSNFIKITLNK